jgi:hypothetical protein
MPLASQSAVCKPTCQWLGRVVASPLYIYIYIYYIVRASVTTAAVVNDDVAAQAFTGPPACSTLICTVAGTTAPLLFGCYRHGASKHVAIAMFVLRHAFYGVSLF